VFLKRLSGTRQLSELPPCGKASSLSFAATRGNSGQVRKRSRRRFAAPIEAKALPRQNLCLRLSSRTTPVVEATPVVEVAPVAHWFLSIYGPKLDLDDSGRWSKQCAYLLRAEFQTCETIGRAIRGVMDAQAVETGPRTGSPVPEESPIRVEKLPPTYDEAEEAWSDFPAGCVNDLFQSLEQGSKSKGTSAGWFWPQKRRSAKDDPLLRFLHHARNSDEAWDRAGLRNVAVTRETLAVSL